MSQLLRIMPKLLQLTTLSDKLLPLGPSTREEPTIATFETTNPNVNLVIFAVEDSGAVHPEAHQFLRSHARLVTPDNSGRELGHSLASLSVSIQAARAKSVTTARDLLSVDALPPQPYITGILPVVPTPAWLAPNVHPRRFAVMPFPSSSSGHHGNHQPTI